MGLSSFKFVVFIPHEFASDFKLNSSDSFAILIDFTAFLALSLFIHYVTNQRIYSDCIRSQFVFILNYIDLNPHVHSKLFYVIVSKAFILKWFWMNPLWFESIKEET